MLLRFLKTVLLTIFCMTLLKSADGQIYYGDKQMIEDRLASLTAELAERRSDFSATPELLFDERRWTFEALEQARNLESSIRQLKEVPALNEELESNWQATKQTLPRGENLTADVIIDWISIDFQRFQREVNLKSVGGRGTFETDLAGEVSVAGQSLFAISFPAPGTPALPQEIVTDFSEVIEISVISVIDTAFSSLAEETVVFQEQVLNSEENAKRLSSDLAEYASEIRAKLQTLESRQSIQSNLPLIIMAIGASSIALILVIRWFPPDVMLVWVESGQVIQFVTVMILLTAILALGLAGLLGEEAIGTLLGGIGGYVLSQGVGRATAARVVKELQQGSSPPSPGEPKNNDVPAAR